ncbi:MAG: ester cyclase [Janthinobacterium lividum]
MKLEEIYRSYLDCLNRRRLDELEHYVCADVVHNGRDIRLAGYMTMIEEDYRGIPDLHYAADLVVGDAFHIAARLRFDCHPDGRFRDVDVNGQRVVFHENVFYRFADGRIQQVWSVIDKDEIARQLPG